MRKGLPSDFVQLLVSFEKTEGKRPKFPSCMMESVQQVSTYF